MKYPKIISPSHTCYALHQLIVFLYTDHFPFFLFLLLFLRPSNQIQIQNKSKNQLINYIEKKNLQNKKQSYINQTKPFLRVFSQRPHQTEHYLMLVTLHKVEHRLRPKKCLENHSTPSRIWILSRTFLEEHKNLGNQNNCFQIQTISPYSILSQVAAKFRGTQQVAALHKQIWDEDLKWCNYWPSRS